MKAKEHEANAEAEKEKEEQETTEASDTNDDASSADQKEFAVKSEPRSPLVFDNETANVKREQAQGSPNPAESCPRDDQSNYVSTEGVAVAYRCERPYEFTPVDDVACFAAHSEDNVAGSFNSDLGVSGPMDYSIEGSADGLGAFSYGDLMFSGLPDGMGTFETRVDELEKTHFTGYRTENVQESIETNYRKASPQSMEKSSPLITQPFHISSSPVVDLAGRRKRPGLALSGIRNATNGPATGIDFSRRALDPGSPMRRVTSATGFGPQGIRRFPSQQRLGMFDRRQESLLSAVRSPNMTPFASMAPPTPDTPAVATHQQSAREATVSSNSSEDEGSVHLYQPTGLSTQHSALDQSIRTPPATPIGAGDVFATSIGATLGYPPTTDESFLASGMDTFSMRSNDFAIPSYITDDYMSQPSTPQLPMSTGYYNAIPATHVEYGWADAAMVSAKSSPNPHQMRQIQFSNVTPQDFSGAK